MLTRLMHCTTCIRSCISIYCHGAARVVSAVRDLRQGPGRGVGFVVSRILCGRGLRVHSLICLWGVSTGVCRFNNILLPAGDSPTFPLSCNLIQQLFSFPFLLSSFMTFYVNPILNTLCRCFDFLSSSQIVSKSFSFPS